MKPAINMESKQITDNEILNEKLFNIPRPMDIKLNIKPLFGKRIPFEVYEGPCRPQDPTKFNRTKEQNDARIAFDIMEKRIEATSSKRFEYFRTCLCGI